MPAVSPNNLRRPKRFPSVLVMVSLILSSFLISHTQAKSARYIAEKTFPSVVMLVMQDSHGQPTSLGSGFFVKEDVVATNLHVIEGAASGYVKIVGKKPKYDIAGFVAIDRYRDLVLLKVQEAKASTLVLAEGSAFDDFKMVKEVKAPILVLADSNDVAVGDEVYAVGNPQGLEGTFSKGIVSSVRKFGKDSLLQITAPISPGSSGGPVLNTEGKVVGVSVATFKGGQNLNFAIPASYLRPLLSRQDPVTPIKARLGAEKVGPALIDTFGEKGTEGVIGTRLTWKYQVLFLPLSGSVIAVSGEYSFSLRNKLRHPVKGIVCVVVFFDRDGEPIDIDLVQHRGTIPPGLAKRVTSFVDTSIPQITTPGGGSTPETKVELRILDFKIAESEDLF